MSGGPIIITYNTHHYSSTLAGDRGEVQGAHLPSEDVLVVDEAGGESLDGALVELGELLAEQQSGLAVDVRA